MLCIQTDLYVTACQIVCSVSLISFFAVNRLSRYNSTVFQVFQKLRIFSVLIDPVAVLISLNGHIGSRRCMKGAGNINGIIFVGKLTDVGFNGFFIQSQRLPFSLQPGCDRIGIQNSRFTSECISYCTAAVFLQLAVQVCNLIFHILCCSDSRTYIHMLVDRYCNDISKKSRIKCCVQICVHSSLQLIRIDLRPLYLLHKGEFFFLLIVLNSCINRSFSIFHTEI